MEKKKQEFYLNKADIMANQKFKELYEYLANEELKHSSSLKNMVKQKNYSRQCESA